MQGKKELKPKLMYQVTLADLVPENNIYRMIERELDLKYTKKPTAANVILMPMWEIRACFLCYFYFFYYFRTECNHIVKYFIEYRIIYFRVWK